MVGKFFSNGWKIFGRADGHGRGSSAADGEAGGGALGKAGFADLALGARDVVLDAAQFDGVRRHVVDGVGGARVAVARLADGADVDEVFAAGHDLQAVVEAAADDARLLERQRDVGVAEEADGAHLVGEVGLRFKFVEDVAPHFGVVQGAVDHHEGLDAAGVAEAAEPRALSVVELAARPFDDVGGEGVEAGQGVVEGAVVVVVAADDVVARQLADFGEAPLGVGVVADDVADVIIYF